MIPAQELMIGNWLMFNGEPMQVAPRTIHYYQKEKYNPIPITPEWLKRLGFEMVDHEWHDKSISPAVYKHGKYIVELIDEKYWAMCQMSMHNSCEVIHVDLKHVHQLQNLLFCLTQWIN